MIILTRAIAVAFGVGQAMESASQRVAHNLTHRLVKRLASVLLPLGVSFEQFVAAAKTGFVEAAADKISDRDGRVSKAKIAVLTGLPRAEVARLRVQTYRQNISLVPRQRAERVMHGWYTDSAFLNDDGSPADLTHPGLFMDLVRKYSGDIPTRALLDELLNVGMVVLDHGGTVRAVSRHYRTEGSADGLRDLEFDVDAFLADLSAGPPSDRSRSRVSADFLGDSVPSAVLRNVTIRTERFLAALSEYLQNASQQAVPMGKGGHDTTTTLNILMSRFTSSKRALRVKGNTS